jgi:adenylate cyclase, class 2
MVQGGIETEVKIRVPDRHAVEELLGRHEFAVSAARLFERNTLYDRPDASLRAAGMLLRLRDAGGQGVVTWKGPGQAGPHKARPEIETTVASIDALERILEHLGFARNFRYEKYRTEYRSDGPGTVTVDETPIGDFLELEGPPDWIDKTAAMLGFNAKDYILESYGGLYMAYCRERGIAPSDMVFR